MPINNICIVKDRGRNKYLFVMRYVSILIILLSIIATNINVKANTSTSNDIKEFLNGRVVDKYSNEPITSAFVKLSLLNDSQYVVAINYSSSGGYFNLTVYTIYTSPSYLILSIQNETYFTYVQNVVLHPNKTLAVGTIYLAGIPTKVISYPSNVITDKNVSIPLHAYAYHEYFNVLSNITTLCNYTWTDGTKILYGETIYPEQYLTSGTYYWNVTAVLYWKWTSLENINYTKYIITKELNTRINIVPYSVDAGSNAVIELNTTGGIVPYKYKIYFSKSTVTTDNNSVYHIFTHVGTDKIIVETYDSDNITINTSYPIIVYPRLSAFINGSSYIDAGISTTYVANVTGGDGRYSYSWYIDGVNKEYLFGKNINLTFPLPGTYKILLSINDSSGGYLNITKNIYVNNTPTLSVSILPGERVDKNSNVTFIIQINGGVAPYTLLLSYKSSIINKYILYNNTYLYICSYDAVGNYTFFAKLTDGDLSTYYVTENISVYSIPELKIIYSQQWDVDVPLNISLYISTGVSPYNISINSGSAIYISRRSINTLYNETYFIIEYNDTGIKNISINIQDSGGYLLNKRINIFIEHKPNIILYSSVNSGYVNRTMTVYAKVRNGTAPFNGIFSTYNDTSGPITIYNDSIVTWDIAYSLTGNYAIYFNLTDRANTTLTYRIFVSIYNILNSNITFSNNPVIMNKTDNFILNIIGGIAPYKYKISIGNAMVIYGTTTNNAVRGRFLWATSGNIEIDTYISDKSNSVINHFYTIFSIAQLNISVIHPQYSFGNVSFPIEIVSNNGVGPYKTYLNGVLINRTSNITTFITSIIKNTTFNITVRDSINETCWQVIHINVFNQNIKVIHSDKEYAGTTDVMTIAGLPTSITDRGYVEIDNKTFLFKNNNASFSLHVSGIYNYTINVAFYSANVLIYQYINNSNLIVYPDYSTMKIKCNIKNISGSEYRSFINIKDEYGNPYSGNISISYFGGKGPTSISVFDGSANFTLYIYGNGFMKISLFNITFEIKYQPLTQTPKYSNNLSKNIDYIVILFIIILVLVLLFTLIKKRKVNNSNFNDDFKNNVILVIKENEGIEIRDLVSIITNRYGYRNGEIMTGIKLLEKEKLVVKEVEENGVECIYLRGEYK